MSKPISVGDLVQIVRPVLNPRCLCNDPNIGMGEIFRVSKISKTESKCRQCKSQLPEELCAWKEGMNEVADMYRLKRIPPLEELEGEKQKEDMREPA